MLGPGSAFFDSEPVTAQQAQDANARQYQQWIAAFGGQQPTDDRHSAEGFRTAMSQAPAPGQYSFNQQNHYSDPFSQFNSSTTDTIRPSTTASREQLSTSTFQPQNMDPYAQYYDRLLDSGMSVAAPTSVQEHTPESTLQSYNGTPEPPFPGPQTQVQTQVAQGTFQNINRSENAQMQHSQHAFQQQANMAAAPTNRPAQFHQQFSRTPLHPQHSNPQSQTSSPPSRSKDVRPKPTNSSPKHSQFIQVRPPAPAKAPPSTSSMQSGSMTASTSHPPLNPSAPSASTPIHAGRTSGKRKRARKDDQDVGSGHGNSDDESDDDDDGDVGGFRVGMAGLGVISSKAGKNERSSRL